MNKDYPEIAIVVYNDLNSNCDDIAQNLIDLTDFKVHGKYNLNIFHTNAITSTIKDLAQQGFSWAVVVTAGNFLQDQTCLIKTIEHAQNNNSPLCCHILDRGGYYHFHQQWFAVDLKTYTAVGSPAFEPSNGPVSLTTVLTQRCQDNVHDDYTPWWIKPAGTEPMTYHSDHGYFGLQVISEFVRNGHGIVNVPTEVRQRKNYCYPDFNHDGLVKIIQNPEYQPEDTHSPLWWFKHAIDQLTSSLKIGYYVLNTEHLYGSQLIESTALDCFIGVCGGLKPACIAGRSNFDSNSKIYLFDISPAALEWQRHLIESWDGEFKNFESVFNNFKNQHPDYFPIYFTSNSLDSNLDWFLSNANITQSQFTALWQRYRNMQHHYVNLNLLNADAAEQILALSNSSEQGSYVWASNAFKMDYLMFYRTRAWCDQHSLNFTNQLRLKTTKPLFIENCGRLDFFQPI